MRRFIAIAEKELELYYRHVALYSDPNSQNSSSTFPSPRKDSDEPGTPQKTEAESLDSISHNFSMDLSKMEDNFTGQDLLESDFDYEEDLLESETHSDRDLASTEFDSNNEESSFCLQESSACSSSVVGHRWDSDNRILP